MTMPSRNAGTSGFRPVVAHKCARTEMRNLIAIALLLCGLAAAAVAQTALKDAYKGKFRIGVALNAAQFSGEDAAGAAITKTHFNSITPENVLKWENVHPTLDKYDFAAPDKYVTFGRKHHMFIVGHTLVWHHQTPQWVFEDDKGKPLGRDALLARMRDHISRVVGRYRGRINGWDVVNEAINEDGTMRQTPWLKIIGEEYIAKAFQYAHEADPKAELYYNEFSLENEPKRNAAIALIRRLQLQGIPVAGIGLQGHDRLDWPTVEQEEATLTALAKLGIQVNITELDIDVLPAATDYRGADISRNAELQPKLNPYVSGLPESVQQELVRRYADLFAIFLRHRDVITRVTFWGVTDRESWLNDWPVKGRTNYPLLFDRQGHPKPAFKAVVDAAGAAR